MEIDNIEKRGTYRSGGHLPGTNGPNGLIGDDDFAPVLDMFGNGVELGGNNINRDARFTLLQRLSNTQDNA